jgi:hypothetical protein
VSKFYRIEQGFLTADRHRETKLGQTNAMDGVSESVRARGMRSRALDFSPLGRSREAHHHCLRESPWKALRGCLRSCVGPWNVEGGDISMRTRVGNAMLNS